MEKRFTGLIAATFTPMHADGKLDLDRVATVVKHLSDWDIGGLYVAGSTGEGFSLTGEERRVTSEAFIRAADGRVPVVIHVGHNSITETQQLAAHAQEIGAAAISAVPPSYYPIDSVETLVACMAEIANAAPATPFYYYHIPHLSGASYSMVEFLRIAGNKIPTLRGVKFTASTLHEMIECLEFSGKRYDILNGFDEMLLAGLAVGVKGAVGCTYNYAAPIYHRLIEAFSQGDMETARMWQVRSAEMIRLISRYRGLAGHKAVMKLIGHDHGPTRLPMQSLTKSEIDSLRQELTTSGFFDWISQPSLPARTVSMASA